MRTSFCRLIGLPTVVILSIAPHATALHAKDLEPPAVEAKQPLAAAEQLLQDALLAEADDNVNARTEKLQQVLKVMPDSAAAHWQAGEIQIGSRWVSIESAAREAALAGKVEEYRKQCAQSKETLDDHIALARFCAKAGLKDHERAQLILALQQDSRCKEALTKLDLVRFRGELLTPAQIDAQRERTRQLTAETKQWRTYLLQLARQYDDRPNKREEVLTSIRNISDVAAIPSMERILGNANERVEIAAVESIKSMPKQQAAMSLVRFFLFTQNTAVREAAAGVLRYRSTDNYVPILLTSLQTPLESSVEGTFGFVRIQVFQEGFTSNKLFSINSNAPRGGRATQRFWQDRETVRYEVDKLNELNEVQNKRIYSLLENIAGEQREATPNGWWDWWFDLNEYQPLEKETEVTSVTRIRASCFVRGTPVWTSTGPMPIEKIKTGETVLSQNPETGELAFKAVLGSTFRPPSPLVEVKTDRGLIRGTRGHPYWVSGKGWQMAKELKAGQLLHGVNGPVRIEAVEQTGEEPCYNLIVADFNTYFIGDAKVLVHDNTLRGPNTIRVPGLVE